MNFIGFNHYSSEKLESFDAHYKYVMKKSMKPHALWFAPKTDWVDWCIKEGYFTQNYTYVYTITKIDTSNILVIKDADDAVDFCETYGGHRYPGNFDWEVIAKKYSGIYIPYFSLEERNKSMFGCYSGLLFSIIDVDSLALWDPSIIKVRRDDFDLESYISSHDESINS